MTPPKRKPNRLSAFDYSSVGAYFITICAKHRKPIFGQVVGVGAGCPGLCFYFQTVEQ